MNNIKEKRKKLCDTLYTAIDIVDKTGKNKERYQAKFESMSDEDFVKFFNDFFDSPQPIVIEYTPYHDEPTIADAQKLAKYIDIPMEEYIVLNHLEEGVVSQYPCLVLRIGIKKLQQMVNKKNSQSIEANTRDPKTGQVTNADKNARVADVENAALIVSGLETVAREFLGPRADDMVAKTEMTSAIMTDGYVSLNNLTNDVRNKVALNTTDAYMLAAGFKSDLVTKDLSLVRTIEQRSVHKK